MDKPLVVVVVALASLLSLVGAPGCAAGSGPGGVECSRPADCGASERPCAGCPPLAEVLCLEGACVERGENTVDVTADVNLHRDVAADVRSFVHALVATTSSLGPVTCASIRSDGGVSGAVNVLAAGYKAVEGGSFHEDVNVGRAPEGELLLVVIATSENAGEGDTLATGCVEGLTAAGSALDAGLVQVAP